MDRIDLHINLEDVNWEELTGDEVPESSAEILKRVMAARKMQEERYSGLDFTTNSRIPPKYMSVFCKTTEKGKQVLEKVFRTMNLSARAYDKVLKVARTIADLDGKDLIGEIHILEAVQYRNMDREF